MSGSRAQKIAKIPNSKKLRPNCAEGHSTIDIVTLCIHRLASLSRAAFSDLPAPGPLVRSTLPQRPRSKTIRNGAAQTYTPHQFAPSRSPHRLRLALKSSPWPVFSTRCQSNGSTVSGNCPTVATSTRAAMMGNLAIPEQPGEQTPRWCCASTVLTKHSWSLKCLQSHCSLAPLSSSTAGISTISGAELSYCLNPSTLACSSNSQAQPSTNCLDSNVAITEIENQ